MLKNIEGLQNIYADKIARAKESIDKIDDPKQKAFLEEAMKKAQNGELDIEQFTKQLENLNNGG